MPLSEMENICFFLQPSRMLIRSVVSFLFLTISAPRGQGHFGQALQIDIGLVFLMVDLPDLNSIEYSQKNCERVILALFNPPSTQFIFGFLLSLLPVTHLVTHIAEHLGRVEQVEEIMMLSLLNSFKAASEPKNTNTVTPANMTRPITPEKRYTIFNAMMITPAKAPASSCWIIRGIEASSCKFLASNQTDGD